MSNYHTRSTVQYRYRAALLVLAIIGAVLLGLALTGDGSPVDVLGCVWERAGDGTTATSDATCLP